MNTQILDIMAREASDSIAIGNITECTADMENASTIN